MLHFLLQLFFIQPAQAVTYYVGTTPSSSYSVQITNPTLQTTIVWKGASSQSISTAMSDCAAHGGRLPTAAELYYQCAQQAAGNTTTVFTVGQPTMSSEVNSGNTYNMCQGIQSGNACWINAQSYCTSGNAMRYFCVPTTTPSSYTVTGTVQLYSDTLQITTASSSGSSVSIVTTTYTFDNFVNQNYTSIIYVLAAFAALSLIVGVVTVFKFAKKRITKF